MRKSMTELPTKGQRWTPARKRNVIQAIRLGHITIDGACLRYEFSEEELYRWMELLDRHGLKGARASRIQDHRERPKSEVIA